jgi:hypothetical protein
MYIESEEVEVATVDNHGSDLAITLCVRTLMMMFASIIIWGVGHAVSTSSPSLKIMLLAGVAFGICWTAWMYFRDYAEIEEPLFTQEGTVWVGCLSGAVGVMYIFLAFNAVQIAQLIAVGTFATSLMVAWARS